MSLSYNGTELQSITYNGADVQTVTMDGVEVWSAHPPFLVRMRYDANEATHVKDLVGGYTITTNTGGAVPAAADPFGGNEALNLDDLWIIYGGSKAIDGLKSTVTFWCKPRKAGTIIHETSAVFGTARVVGLVGSFNPYIGSQTSSGSASLISCDAIPQNQWSYIEMSTDGSIVRLFVNGILKKQATHSIMEQARYYKKANVNMFISQFAHSGYYEQNKFKGDIYDLCILNGIWHTENYNVPTAYI